MRDKRYISIIHKIGKEEYYIREHNNLLDAIEYIIIGWNNMSLNEKRNVLINCENCETIFSAMETLRTPDEIIKIFKNNPKLIFDYGMKHFDLIGCIEYDTDLKLNLFKAIELTSFYHYNDSKNIFDKAARIIYIRKENKND